MRQISKGTRLLRVCTVASRLPSTERREDSDVPLTNLETLRRANGSKAQVGEEVLTAEEKMDNAVDTKGTGR